MNATDETRQSALEDNLRRRYPERRRLRISRMQEITHGWETRIFAFSLHYAEAGRDRHEELILRTFEGSHAVQRAEREFRVMQRVGKLGMPVPRVDLLFTVGSPALAASIVMERIRGESLVARMEAAAPTERGRLLEPMVRHIVRLHAIHWREVFSDEDFEKGSPGETPGFVSPDLERMRAAMERHRLQDFEPVLRWLEAHAIETVAGPSLLHNDYHPENIMLRADGDEMVILDWSFAGVGDFRLDLAWSGLQLGVALGNRHRNAFLNRYIELSDRSLEGFEFFEALKLGARLMTITVWLGEDVEIPVTKITRNAIRTDYKVHVLNVYHRFTEITGHRIPLIENL